MSILKFISGETRVRWCLMAWLTLISVGAWAAPSFTVEAPRRVNQGAKFKVCFVLRDSEGENFTPPQVSGADKIYGPGISTSYSQSWVNGKSSSSSSQEFTMIYKALHTGKVTVGAASIVVDGKRLSTKPLTIEVVDSDKPVGNQQQQQSSPAPSPRGGVQFDDPLTQGDEKAVGANDIFVRIEMSKPRVYEQQAVVCTIKLYTKYQVSQFLPTLQPSFDGFLIEEIPMQPSLNNVETYNGQQYMVAVLKKCILYPQQSGNLTITSGNYDVSVVQYENYRTLFGTLSNPVEKELKVSSNSATVNILPLPEPKPATFTGAVGNFTVTTAVKPAQLKTYQAATYTLNITGKGNIKYIKAPEVQFPKEMDVYDPKIETHVNPGGGDMSGTVKIDYTFIPQFAGDFTIPASEFSFFNPETGQYETVQIPERKLHIAKGEGTPSNHYRLRNLDIRHIHKGDLDLSAIHAFMVDSPIYWLALALPLLALAGLVVYFRKRLRERADVKHMRLKQANKVARKRLKRASAFLDSGDRNGFYSELLTALWGYLSDKLDIPVSELSKDNIQTELAAYGVGEDLQTETLDLLDRCEFAQYAPELSSDDPAAMRDRTATLIANLERVKRAVKTE